MTGIDALRLIGDRELAVLTGVTLFVGAVSNGDAPGSTARTFGLTDLLMLASLWCRKFWRIIDEVRFFTDAMRQAIGDFPQHSVRNC